MVIKISHSPDLKRQLRQLEIALVIDNTGSMGKEILQVRKGLGDLVDRITTHPLKPLASFAVVGYRDHPPQDSTFVSQIFCGLDINTKQVGKALDMMRAKGGGDGPEAVVDGLHSALLLNWSKIAQKALLLVGDSSPHGEGGAGDGFPGGCPCGWNMTHITEQMVSSGVVGHAIGVRSDPAMVRTFSEFAKSTGGIFVHLDKLSDLIPVLLKRVEEEMGKIAADIRTIEKIESGGPVTAADHKSLERLQKKGVRVMAPFSAPAEEADESRKLRIRILS